jgi:Metallo-beta-lactamase superfamily
MKTTPVTANAFQLTRLGLVNCYLVRESDGLTLIDTGLPGSADGILAAARGLGAPIRRILLTHAHIDHVGSVDDLTAKLGPSNVELAASARSLPLLQQPPDKALEPGEPAGKIKGGLPGIKTRPTRLVAEGELYGSLRSIATPGHIPGHLSFLDERDGTLSSPVTPSSAWAASPSAALPHGSFRFPTSPPGTKPQLSSARASCSSSPSNASPPATARSSPAASTPSAPPSPEPPPSR